MDSRAEKVKNDIFGNFDLFFAIAMVFSLNFTNIFTTTILLLSFLHPNRDIGYLSEAVLMFACNVVLGGSIDCRSKSPKGAGAAS